VPSTLIKGVRIAFRRVRPHRSSGVADAHTPALDPHHHNQLHVRFIKSRRAGRESLRIKRECVRTQFALAAAEGATMGGWKRKTSTGDVRSWNKFAQTKYSRQGRALSAQIYAKTLPKFKWGFFWPWFRDEIGIFLIR
jgi:hypothetical protein